MEVITIGVDLAKNVFQVHSVDAEGDVVIGRQYVGPGCCRFSRNCRRA